MGGEFVVVDETLVTEEKAVLNIETKRTGDEADFAEDARDSKMVETRWYGVSLRQDRF